MTVCHGIERAFQHPDVRIGWYPFTAVADTGLVTKPDTGRLVADVAKGAHLAVQSVRNPSGDAHPAQRDPYITPSPDNDAYLWAYAVKGHKTGWVRAADIKFERRLDAAPLLGPAGYDFEVGRTLPLPKKPNGCGKLSQTRPVKIVGSTECYLRYSARGTAFHYLHRGDALRLLIADAPGGFAFVEVLTVKTRGPVQPGCRGWVPHVCLKDVL